MRARVPATVGISAAVLKNREDSSLLDPYQTTIPRQYLGPARRDEADLARPDADRPRRDDPALPGDRRCGPPCSGCLDRQIQKAADHTDRVIMRNVLLGLPVCISGTT